MSASAALATLGCKSADAGSQGADAADAQVDEGASPLLAIIHTNDTHGHDVEVETTDDVDGNFCMAAVASLKAEYDMLGYKVLLVDAGDATQGMPLVDQSNGESAITFMNACGYDLMAVGNHEFDRGGDQLASYEKAANFPLVSANVLVKETGENRFAPTKIFELFDGSKVGFIGLTTPATRTTASPKHTEPFDFLAGEDLYACVQEQVDDLRAQGCDLVVCVGHLGNEAACKPSTSRDVLENVTGIDLFIDGHDHQVVSEEVAGTLLVETGCYLANIGLVVIDEGVPTDQPVAYGTYDAVDQPALAVISGIDEEVQAELGVVLAHTDFKLEGDKMAIRSGETNLGDLCCDSLLWAAEVSSGIKPDGALCNGGGMRNSIEAGDISLANIKSVFAFSNQVVILKLTGAQLLEALEASCQSIGQEGAIGAFPQVAGIEFTIDASVPYEMGPTYPDSTFCSPAAIGSRVTISQVGERAWDPEETYAIATIGFLCEGGDTYYVFKQAAEKEAPITCDFDYESLSGYLVGPCDHEVPSSYEQPQGRITILGA